MTEEGVDEKDLTGAATISNSDNVEVGKSTYTTQLEGYLQAKTEELNLFKAKNAQLQERLETSLQDRKMDILESEDVKRIILLYKQQINDLNEKIKAFHSNPGESRMIEEIQLLRKKNRMHLVTNTSLCKQTEDLTAKLNQAYAKVESLEKDCELMSTKAISCSVQSENVALSAPQVQPEGDSDVLCDKSGCYDELACNHPSAVSTETIPKECSFEQQQNYLQHYCNLVINLQNKNKELESETMVQKHHILQQQKQLKRFIQQVRQVGTERDILRRNLESLSQQQQPLVESCVYSTTTASVFEESLPSTEDNEAGSRRQFGMEEYEVHVSKLREEANDLERRLSHKEDHVLEQEEKIEKLVKQISIIERERDELKTSMEIIYSRQCEPRDSNNASTCLQDENHKLLGVIEDLRRVNDDILSESEKRNRKIEEMYRERENLILQNEALKKENIRINEQLDKEPEVSRDVYEVQLKAFQDDWKAEHEEKSMIMQQSRKLKEDYDKLLNEVENNRLLQSQYSSPPTSFETAVPLTPPTHNAHQVGPNQIPHLGPMHGNPYFPNDPHPSINPASSYPISQQVYGRPQNQNSDRHCIPPPARQAILYSTTPNYPSVGPPEHAPGNPYVNPRAQGPSRIPVGIQPAPPTMPYQNQERHGQNP